MPRHNPRQNPAKAFGILAIVFVLIGFGIYLYISQSPKIIDEDHIKYGVDQRTGEISYEYRITKSGWQDTGLWVGPGKFLPMRTRGAAQPFEVRIGEKEIKSFVGVNSQFFFTQVYTVITPEEDIARNTVYVPNQERLFLRIHPEATVDELPIHVYLRPGLGDFVRYKEKLIIQEGEPYFFQQFDERKEFRE